MIDCNQLIKSYSASRNKESFVTKKTKPWRKKIKTWMIMKPVMTQNQIAKKRMPKQLPPISMSKRPLKILRRK